MINYHIIPVTAFFQNCSLIWCIKSRLAALIDPGGNAKKIKKIIARMNLKVIKILLTHGHLDHVGAASELSKYYCNIPIIGPEKKDRFWLQRLPDQSRAFGLDICQSFIPDKWLNEGDTINIGNITLQVLHCPGHTPGHVVFFEKKTDLLISGDVIFKEGIGRSDFPYSSYNTLIESIKNKLFPLGDNVKFIPGHGPMSFIGHERLYNPFI